MNTNTSKNSTRAPDPRPARTRAAILDAIERLGSEGGELTVAGVVNAAGISRSSFYSQFKDMNDVAVQLVREFHERIEPLDPETLEHGTAAAVKQSLSSIIAEFGSRRGLYAAVLGEGAVTSVYWELAQIIAEGALANTKPTVPEGVDSEIAVTFLASGVLASVAHWLREEHPRSADELLEQISLLLPAWITGDTPSTDG